MVGGILRGEVGAVAPDDDADLALEIEILAARRHRHLIVRAHQRVGIREVEDRDLEELLGQLEALGLPDHLDVLAERHEISHGRRPRDGRQQAHAVDPHHLGGRRERLGPGHGEPLTVVAEQVDQPRPAGIA